MKDFFISYRSTEEEWAERIAGYLRDAGWSVVSMRDSFLAGPNVTKQMNDALNNSRCTIVILSKDYFNSAWCDDEYHKAESMALGGYGHQLLPVRINNDPLPPAIAARVTVDLSNCDEKQMRVRLLEAAWRITSRIKEPVVRNLLERWFR